VLSPESLQTLTAVDLGAQIQAGLGITVDDVKASEVVLLTMMPDDSGSKTPQVLLRGHSCFHLPAGAGRAPTQPPRSTQASPPEGRGLDNQ